MVFQNWLWIIVFGLLHEVCITQLVKERLNEDPSEVFFFHNNENQIESFNQAKDICKKHKGALATVHTKKRQADLVRLVSKANCNGN